MNQRVQSSRAGLFIAIALLSFFSIMLSLVGCSRSQPSNATITVTAVTNNAEHDRYYLEGSALIKPYMRLSDASSKSADSDDAKKDIYHGIALLNAVVAYDQTNWAAWWVIGKGYQALGESDQACNAFGKSYAINRDNVDVAREYMISCLDVGRNQDAVSVAEYAVSLSPNDAGLHANLALAYTIAGRLKDAQFAISKSLQIDPHDQISLSLSNIIEQIVDGKRPQPHTIHDIQGS